MDQFQTTNELHTHQGELLIRNFVLPNNLKNSDYVLEIWDLSSIDPKLSQHLNILEPIELKIQLISKKK